MWKIAATILLLPGTILGATIFHCPEGTTCPELGAIESTSFQFLDKLGPKQYQTITKLTVLNASLDKVPAELKYLRKLDYLDLSDNNIHVSSIPSLPHLKTLKLSRNNIKGISLTLLPRNIENLDLSNNLLSHIPKDWTSLRALKIIHLHKNLIDCDCFSNNILTYGKLVKQGIIIPEDITCYVPKYFAGKHINSINCTAEDQMINDQPEEGSGAGEDIFSEMPVSLVPYFHEQDAVEGNELIDDKDDLPQEQTLDNISTAIVPEEGSGDEEGSGFVSIENVEIPACVYDCLTPEPVGIHDTKNDTRPVPSPTDQMKMIIQDVINPILGEPTLSTSTTVMASTTEIPISLSSSTTSSKEVSEGPLTKVFQANNYKESDIGSDVESLSNESRTGELEKATALNQNNYAVYIVVVCGLLLAVVFLVCLIKKRKAKRTIKNRRDIPSGFGEEMKPLEKPSIKPVNEKNGKTPNSIPEYIPLINGQNGKPRDEPILKSFIPLEHPESNVDDLDEPVIREKQVLLTPVTERVTIRASEIPESIPKTPVLVHRQKNSEGEIVTTVVPP